MNSLRRLLLPLLLATMVAAISPSMALAANPATDPGLGAAAPYAILAGTTITASGAPSWITGRIGVSPAVAITGFPPSMSGPQDTAGGAAPGQAALTTAFGNASTPPELAGTPVGPNLTGLTLTPGVYDVTAAASNLTGTLTLNGSGVYVFRLSSTLITSAGSVVSLIGGAQPCQVFWQVNSSATIGAGTTFVGTIMALTDIGMFAGATLNGRALARNGQVTLINNRIIQAAGCGFPAPNYVAPPAGTNLPATLAPSSPILGVPNAGVPEQLLAEIPWLMVIGLASGFAVLVLSVNSRRRRRRT